jgi:hypothetical protein
MVRRSGPEIEREMGLSPINQAVPQVGAFYAGHERPGYVIHARSPSLVASGTLDNATSSLSFYPRGSSNPDRCAVQTIRAASVHLRIPQIERVFNICAAACLMHSILNSHKKTGHAGRLDGVAPNQVDIAGVAHALAF